MMETPTKKERDIEEIMNSPPIYSPGGADSQENYWTMNHEERKVKRLKLEKEAASASEPLEPKLWDLTPGWRKQTIKMRVTSIKMFAYTRDPSKWLLKFTGMDESGEVGVSAFHPDSTRFYESLKVNKAVEITNVTVRENEGNYKSLTGFPYQLRLNNDSTISPLCPDDLPELSFKFGKKIADLRKEEVKANGEFVDLVAILCMNDGLQTNPLGSKFRKVHVTDDSYETLAFYLNGWDAINFGEEEEFPVILRKFRMGEHKQKHILKTTELSSIIRDVRNFPEATALWESFLKAKDMRSRDEESSGTCDLSQISDNELMSQASVVVEGSQSSSKSAELEDDLM